MSDLDDAIAAARRDIAREESPVRRALQDAYQNAVDELQGNLDAITRQIADARASGVEVTPDWLRRQMRYRTLMAQAEAEFARFSREGLRIVEGGRARAVSGGAAQAWELAAAAGAVRATTGMLANINTPAVERLVAALSDDSPLRGVLDGYGTRGRQVIEDALVQGVIDGTGPREIVRQIRRELGGRGTRARLEALIRSEMLRAFEGSLFDQYAAMGLDKWRWSCAKSTRTCLACLAMDGRVFPMRDPFMPRHVCCRCIPTPYVESVAYETGEDWLRRQPEATRRAMLPSREAFAAYEAGEIGLGDFVGHRRSKVWGTSIRQRSGREALSHAGVR